MSRFLAMTAALALTTVTVSSACDAASARGLGFTLEPSSKSERIRATFRNLDRDTSNWSSAFAPNELAGLDVERFQASGTSPINFAIVREAGRVDCAGSGGNSLARGSCRVTPDVRFHQLLARRGIGAPTEQQAYGLISLNVRHELIEALAAARYPTPKISDLMSLTAVGVTSPYIDGLARAGYRPQSLDTLLQFKALGITPDFIQGFVRLGYANLPPGELVQLKALNVTADYIAGFERIGYSRLPASQLVQMKALGVTPQFVQGVQRSEGRLPSPGRAVQLKAIGFSPRAR